MRSIGYRRIVCCLALFAAVCPAPVWPQQSRLPLPTDELGALANAAEAAAAAGNFDDAVQQWQTLLELPEDYVDPATRRRSLKSRVEQSLLAAPAGGLDAYEQRFGAQARALLNDALRDHDRERLSEVVRRYFGTLAGHVAAGVFAQRLADDGDALSAARVYDRLAEHPRSTPEGRADWLIRAAACWRLAGFEQAARERLAARDGAPADAETWFAQRPEPGVEVHAAAIPDTPTFRGNPQRNAEFAPAVPVGPLAWQYPVVDEGDNRDPSRIEVLTSRLDLLRDRFESADGERVLIPAGVPVTAGGLAVFRGPGTIKAVSLATGQLAWCSVHIDDTFHHLVEQEWSRHAEDWHGANLDLLLAQRMYRDATNASLSTDGRFVYAIADGGMMSSVSQSAVALPALAEHQLAPHSSNRLLIFELRGGRFVREFGGPTTTEPLSGAFFLGAPLPVDGRLFCLVENQGQVQLVVLDQQRHDVLWVQALYNPNVNLSNPLTGMARRMAGLVPSVSGDIVVCPTGETTVVAVDRRRRMLLWTHEYQRPVNEPPQQALAIRMLMARQQTRGRIEDQLTDELLSADHWQDTAPVIDGEYVLVTPPDSQTLLCLRLLDGVEVWRRPRGARQWVAAVHHKNVVLIGEEQIEALHIEDGEPAWTSPVTIPHPGGRGFRQGRWYVLPLATGEVASIDLASGRLTARTRLPEAGGSGNLVAADGRIVCQTADSLQAFRSLDQLTADVAERLAARPDDAAALFQRGEIQLHLGDEPAALDNLRRALQADPGSPARRLLATTLIEGLRADFDTYRSAAPEIEQLASNVAEQALFHRLFASGLQRRGEIDAAFQQYLRFADSTAGLTGLQRIDGARQVRSDLWIAGRLQELLDAAGDEERARLQAELSGVVNAELADGRTARLSIVQRVIDDPQVRARIDRRLFQDDSLSDPQGESLLLRMLSSDNSVESAYATAELADRWLEVGRTSGLLDRLLTELSGPLGEVLCLNGRTGAELLAEWRSDLKRAAIIDAPEPWPTQRVAAEERSQSVPAHSYAVQQMGHGSELFGGWSFYTDAQGANLIAYDRLGQHAWQVATGMSGMLRGGRGPNYIRYVATYDRFLLLVVEDQWTLFDVFATDGDPKVLANQRLAVGDEGPAVLPNIARFNQQRRNRNGVWIDPQGGTALLGNVGPIVNGVFVYQRGHRLAAVSVVTGEELWTHDLPELAAGGDITADERTVTVWPSKTREAPDIRELLLFRAVDGTAMGSAKLPPHVLMPQPDGYWGTRLVTLDRGVDGKRFDVGMFDPVGQSVVWRRSLAGVLDWGVIEGSDFYVLQDDGNLRVIGADDGLDRMQVSLPEGETAELATVWSDHECWYAATFRTPTDERALIDSQHSPLPDVHGVVLAVSKQTGAVLWTVPVLHQHLQLHTHLPGNWPFIMLSSQIADPRGDARGRSPDRSWSLLLLEKSTGRILLETTAPGRTEQHGWLSDPEHHRIHLATGTIRITLEFSDPAAEQPAADDPE